MKFYQLIIKTLVTIVFCAAFFTPSLFAEEAQDKIDQMIQNNRAHLKSFFSLSQTESMRNLLGAARAIFVAPEVTSGGFLLGMQKGEGMLLRRHGKDWSDPVFMSLSDWNVGLQAGVMESSIIMLIMTDKATDELISGTDKLSGTGGFALGTWGLGATGAGGVKGGLEVITVSTSKGAYLGGVMGDQDISVLQSLNEQAYGKGYGIVEILSQPGGSLPAADGIRSDLKEAVIKSWAE
ncbi:lipid-binding SYLF domain-containing protein [Desulfogranum marinum]|uniref:lipid-binding SYLF domain-containing protein n=1 Tax=Desulfogranum marinum TaxID=453220 RepID=UPI001962BAD4|nr:lipid-binding SYLF domain-containing protein [Desulfogranum marinum]MBM9513703.1 lipid-binding SYLF domain-containing protein [Desulfogranum marinum]